MLRLTLLLTAGLLLLPASAIAQGDDCPLHKRLETLKVTQSAELNRVNTADSVTEASEISTQRQSAPDSRVPSPQPVAERRVDIHPKPVMMAENAPQQITETSESTSVKIDSKKDMAMTTSRHADWTALLQIYVGPPDSMGLTHFDYAGLKANVADKARLDTYIKRLESMNPEALPQNEAIAFWANLYNAVTIQVVTEKFPVKSIRKLGAFNSGPWKKDLVTVNGKKMSLDDIEHGTLRKKYPSPYIHYMVNCASVGCPNLLDTAWEAETLEAKRLEAANAYINSPRGALVKGDKLTVSSIYNWFQEDFGGSKNGVVNHLREHATDDLAEAIDSGAKIAGYDYDWSLNK